MGVGGGGEKSQDSLDIMHKIHHPIHFDETSFHADQHCRESGWFDEC